MNGFVFLWMFIAVVIFLIAIECFRNEEDGSGLLSLLFVGLFAWFSHIAWDTPESLAREAERAKAAEAQRVSELTPRKLSEADGCTVYTFKPAERWLYFTKCNNARTTTQNQWAVTTRSGKTTRSHEETMEIKTK